MDYIFYNMDYIKYAVATIAIIITLNVTAQDGKTVPSTTHKVNTKQMPVNKRKPNIIYILADDLGIGDVSCYGADNYKTPNIDKLADNGIRFNRAYTAPLCGPSRALILTGRYAFRTGATNQDKTGLMKPSDEIMMPTVLKKAGYITSSIGKWGQLPLGPAEFGFDDYLRFRGSGVYWSKDKKKAEHYILNGVDKVLKDKEYMPDLMHEHLVEFLAKNKDKPFYVYYPMSHVHATIVPTPDSKPDSKDLFADNIAYMDKLVGKLINVLDSLKLRDNTLIVFFGDNGTGGAWASRSTIGGKQLVGKKGEMKECGSLVPLIANWPRVITPHKINNQLIDATDFFPTLAEITGAKLIEHDTLDGRSFAPALFGKKGNPRDWIFMELGQEWYVRDSMYKLNRKGELYDMHNSPYEEPMIAADTKDAAAIAARISLQGVLDKLNPAGGKLDDGDGSGRHANKAKNKKHKAVDMEEDEVTAPTNEVASVDSSNLAKVEKYNKLKKKLGGGDITREKFIASMQDTDKATKRFDKLDINHDGILTEEEFVGKGE